MAELLNWCYTKHEEQSGHSRVKFAEGLISQLPLTHDGRNTWLLNYGTGEEAEALRFRRGVAFETATQAAYSYYGKLRQPMPGDTRNTKPRFRVQARSQPHIPAHVIDSLAGSAGRL